MDHNYPVWMPELLRLFGPRNFNMWLFGAFFSYFYIPFEINTSVLSLWYKHPFFFTHRPLSSVVFFLFFAIGIFFVLVMVFMFISIRSFESFVFCRIEKWVVNIVHLNCSHLFYHVNMVWLLVSLFHHGLYCNIWAFK